MDFRVSEHFIVENSIIDFLICQELQSTSENVVMGLIDGIMRRNKLDFTSDNFVYVGNRQRTVLIIPSFVSLPAPCLPLSLPTLVFDFIFCDSMVSHLGNLQFKRTR